MPFDPAGSAERRAVSSAGGRWELSKSLPLLALVIAVSGLLTGCADPSVKSGPVTYSVPCSPALVRVGVAF